MSTPTAGARANLQPSVLRTSDAIGTGMLGMLGRRGRTILTAVGISIGIAALVAVVGISASSQANVLAVLDDLGTNYLRVQPGQSIMGGDAELDPDAAGRMGRIDEVQAVGMVAALDASMLRNDRIPATNTRGTGVYAASDGLVDTLNAELAQGVWLDASASDYPSVVLGPTAAERHGVSLAAGGQMVWIGGQWFAVVGVLEPLPLATELDNGAFVSERTAADLFGYEGSASTLYIRADPADVETVRQAAPFTVNPGAPEEVEVHRPSDALEARAIAETAFTSLLLGLGGVALLVGGVGIANVMVISVLERRHEIGIRRALGATRRHIRIQFIVESVLQAGAGGLAGVLLGAAITAAYAISQQWPIDVPVAGLAGGVVAALLIGALAGLYPAGRAARLDPAEAVRTA